MKTKRSKWDPNSIRAVSLMYFMVFAAVILLMVWFMQSFFMNTYYERMMAQEAQTTANKLGNYYSTNKDNFDAYARKAADRNGLYISVRNSRFDFRIWKQRSVTGRYPSLSVRDFRCKGQASEEFSR